MCSDSPLGDPTCVFFHGTAPLMVSPCLPLAETFCPLCCVAISPQAGCSLPQRLPYVVLPLGQSICVIPTWYLLTQDVAPQRPLLGVRFLSVILPTVWNSSGCHLCLSIQVSSLLSSLLCPIFHPNWCGGTCRLLQGTGGGQQ